VLESPPAKKQKICAAASPMPITTEQKAIAFTRREAQPSSKRPSATPRGSDEGLSRRPRRPLQRGRGPLRCRSSWGSARRGERERQRRSAL
jgi:hypothetical protein